MRLLRCFHVVLPVVLAFGSSSSVSAAPIVDVSVDFDASSQLYSYDYVVSGVDAGRKVTGVGWVVVEGANAAQPDSLPLSWDIPFFWSLLPGANGPIAGGVWEATTGASDGINDFPVDPTWGVLLNGQSRSFRLVTGYAPRSGTYYIVENEVGSELNYNFFTGTTVVPNYLGNLIETSFVGQNTLNVPAGFPPDNGVPEPMTFAYLLTAIAASVLRAKKN
jgi:hypothetical protein